MEGSHLPMVSELFGPSLFAVTGGVLFGAQANFGRRGLDHMGPQEGAMVTIGAATLVFWLMAPFSMKSAYWFSPGFWIFLTNGMIHPTVSMLLIFEANRRMGPTISSTVAATAPLFATAGAVVTLGEALTVPVLAGTLATVVGVVVLSWRRSGLAEWSLAALFFPLGAAVVRAISFVWGKHGLEELDSPYFASTVTFSVAFLISASVYLIRKRGRPTLLPRKGVLWCSMGGTCVAGAILCMYTALSRGQVIIVAPLINTYPMFTLALALAFRQESLGTRIVMGVFLVVGGVALILAF